MEYDSEAMWLQFYFEDPEDVSASLTDQYEIKVTFWGTKYFKNTMDVEVPVGTQLN